MERCGARKGDFQDLIGMRVDSLVTAVNQVFLDIHPSPRIDASVPHAIHERLGPRLRRRVSGDGIAGIKGRGFVSHSNTVLPIVAKLLGIGPEKGKLVMDGQPALQGVDLTSNLVQRHGANSLHGFGCGGPARGSGLPWVLDPWVPDPCFRGDGGVTG